MSTIDFVVRSGADGLQRGTLSGAGADASVMLGSGQDVSLHLQRSHVLSYAREGQALQVMLVDGQTITIQGFFGSDGIAQNNLFLSSGGQLTQVQLVNGDGNLMLAQYIDEDSFGKWSPDDDLYFIEVAALDATGTPDSEAGMLGVPLLAGLGGIGGGAAAAGAAALGSGILLASGGGDGDEDETGTEPSTGGAGGAEPDAGTGGGDTDTDNENDGSESDVDGDGDSAPQVDFTSGVRSTGDGINGESWDDGVTLTGTGTAGGNAVLTVNGQDLSFVIPESGQWSVDLPKTVIGEGEYESGVSVTVTTSGGSAVATDFVDVDTINDITIDTSRSGDDGTVNATERLAGLTVTGTAEANIDVNVTMGTVTRTTQTDGSGNWSYTFDAADVAVGEYDIVVKATSTDAAGNTGIARGTVTVDTELNVSFDGSTVETDGTINHVERADGVTLSGTADAGADVRVQFRGGTHTVVANADGEWSADFSASEIGSGNIEASSVVNVRATDAAGNVATTSGTVQVDTFVNQLTQNQPVEGDDVVNRAEASDGVTLTGKVETGSTLLVTFDATSSGASGAKVTEQATVDRFGNWSVTFASDQIPQGTYQADVTMNATDAAGNVRSITDTFEVDTDVPDAPTIEGIGDYQEGVTFVSIDSNPDDISVHSYDAGGNGKLIIAHDTDGMQNFPQPGMETFGFDNPVVNGKQLVVTAKDDAGNSNSTLLVVDATNPIDVTAQGLSTFNVGSIDLSLADNSTLTLTKASLEALSDNDNVLVVHGAIDDTVNFEGAAPVKTGQTNIEGQAYNVYSLGDDAELIIDQDITFNQSIV